MDATGTTQVESSDPALNDIQSYLDNFNKEISNGGNQQQPVQVLTEGTAYYTVKSEGEKAGQREASATGDSVVLTNVASTSGEEGKEGAIQVAAADGQNNDAVVLSANQYQTVTIVPSDVDQSGEMSYVLIVSQPEKQDEEEKQITDADMSVYDFKEDRSGMNRGMRMQPRKPITGLPSQLMCSYCNYTSPKRYLLTRHMKTHSEERPHKCSICDRGFKTVASLQNHINTHTGTKPHKCKECDSAFTTSGELVRHVRYRHTYEKPHRCTECDYSSVELSKLKRHMRSHTGERPYACPHCAYASPDTYKLKRHLRVHTGEKPYICDVCDARFTQSNSLKAHMLIHSGNKPVYQCELCPTTCGRKTDLKIHIQKLHTSDKPIPCRKCGKSFPDRYTYKIHLKTHEGEKCFRCDFCPYAALNQRHLESHILTHTGEKPFQCDECEQTFRQKQLLRRHKNLYHSPEYIPPNPREKAFECSASGCDKSFAHRGNLIRHMQQHEEGEIDGETMMVKAEGDLMLGEQGENLVGEMVDEEGNTVQQVVLIQQPDGQVQVVRKGDSQPLIVTNVADPSAGVEEALATGEQSSRADKEKLSMDGDESINDDDDNEMRGLKASPSTPGEVSRRGRGRPPKRPKMDDEDYDPSDDAEYTPRGGRGPRKEVSVVDEPVAKRQTRESVRTRVTSKGESDVDEKKEQKKKDIEECFGFDS